MLLVSQRWKKVYPKNNKCLKKLLIRIRLLFQFRLNRMSKKACQIFIVYSLYTRGHLFSDVQYWVLPNPDQHFPGGSGMPIIANTDRKKLLNVQEVLSNFYTIKTK